MRVRIVLLLILTALLLGGCGYWAVEEAPVTVGDAVIRLTPTPTAQPLEQ